MYFPARDGTASGTLLSARPGLQFCSGKDQTLFKKTQTRACRVQMSREAVPSARELCIQTTSWRLALTHRPRGDVLARHGARCHRLPPALPSDSPSVTAAGEWADWAKAGGPGGMAALLRRCLSHSMQLLGVLTDYRRFWHLSSRLYGPVPLVKLSLGSLLGVVTQGRETGTKRLEMATWNSWQTGIEVVGRVCPPPWLGKARYPTVTLFPVTLSAWYLFWPDTATHCLHRQEDKF